MTADALAARLREVLTFEMPLPGGGRTAVRHRRLMEVGREDLSLARLAEAHWDAVAILAEAGRKPEPGAIYGVWASEVAGQALQTERTSDMLRITGVKHFCSGVGFVNRALVTLGDGSLADVDVRSAGERIRYDDSGWMTSAFAATRTSTAMFQGMAISASAIVGDEGWYTARPGFWHGACGPAACWAGGAEGLLDYAKDQRRDNAHTLAHLGAIHAAIWAVASYMETAGREMDEDAANVPAAQRCALSVRHLVEQACTDVLRRVARAYGPRALAMDSATSTRYSELDLYLRQSHAERDLEALGRSLKEGSLRG